MRQLNLDPKSRAHQCLNSFHSICDDFNEGFLNSVGTDYASVESLKAYPIGHLRILQSMSIEAFDLIKYLHSQQPCEATKNYMIFCGKVLLRLSHLIHNGRKETDQELGQYMSELFSKYNLREVKS